MSRYIIKPCPFCGVTPQVAMYEHFVFAVECRCGATQTVSTSEKEAVGKWNTRKPIDNEMLARFLNQISQNDIHFDDCSKMVQTAYRDKAKFIIDELSKY